jgi:chromosome partitioning protein
LDRIHAAVPLSTLPDRAAAEADEKARFEAALEQAIGAVDFVIVDTPGSDTHLSRLAHVAADTLLTPLNDSFIDLDLLARVDPDTLKILRPSIYAEAVWKQRQLRAVQGGRPVDWVVMRNRLSSLAAATSATWPRPLGAGQTHRLSHRRRLERARDLQGAVPERPHPALTSGAAVADRRSP